MNLDQKIYFLYKAMMAAFRENNTSREDMDSIEDIFDEATKLLRLKHCHNSKKLCSVDFYNEDYDMVGSELYIAESEKDAERQAMLEHPNYDPEVFFFGTSVIEFKPDGSKKEYNIILEEVKK